MTLYLKKTTDTYVNDWTGQQETELNITVRINDEVLPYTYTFDPATSNDVIVTEIKSDLIDKGYNEQDLLDVVWE